MVAVAEEVKRPERAMPIAIVLTLAVSATLYVSLAFVAISIVPVAELSASEAPIALIYGRTTGYAPATVAAVSVMALLNGALVQVIKAARAIYGMASEGLVPRAAGVVDARTRTPLRATVAVSAIVLALALLLRLEQLAALTSAATLSLFALSNFALCRLKLKGGPAPAFRVPMIIPAAAGLSSLAFIGLGLLGYFAR
jgi:amino acid transporter